MYKDMACPRDPVMQISSYSRIEEAFSGSRGQAAGRHRGLIDDRI